MTTNAGLTTFRRAATLALTAAISVAVAALTSCAGKTPPQPPQQEQLARAVAPPEGATRPPEELPGVARAILKTRMASHAQDMGALVSAIMILDYPSIDERARRIAADVSLSRPITGDATELASQLPDNFFAHQDKLRARAKVLATAAAQRKALAVADAYGRVSETCVRCHAEFRPPADVSGAKAP